MIVQPYLFFDGRCEEALEFYRQGLGGQIKMPLAKTFFPRILTCSSIASGYPGC